MDSPSPNRRRPTRSAACCGMTSQTTVPCTWRRSHSISICAGCRATTAMKRKTTMMNKTTMSESNRKRIGLAGTLANLIDSAETSNDQKFHAIYLRGGLQVEVGINQKFNLRLSRENARPGDVEWRTVLKHLPAAYQPAEEICPRYSHPNTKRHQLDAAWDYQRRML